jgi:hypothetical protein
MLVTRKMEAGEKRKLKLYVIMSRNIVSYKNYLTDLFGPWTYFNLNHVNSTRFTTIQFTIKYSGTYFHRKKRPTLIHNIKTYSS